MQEPRFKIGDRVIYGKLRCVVAYLYQLNGEWLYDLSDRVGGEIFFESVPEADLEKIQ